MSSRVKLKRTSTSRSSAHRTVRRRRVPGRPGTSDLSVGAAAITLKACELLREVAPRALSLSKLAGYAGVDRSLIRYYFDDRSSLLLAAARHLFELLKIRLDAVQASFADNPEARIREMAAVLLAFQIEHPYFHRLMIDEVVNSPKKEARAFFRMVTEEGVRTFRDMATASARRGMTRPHDGVFLYLAIIGMCEFFVTGHAILEVAFGEEFDATDVNRKYLEFLRSYVIDGIRKR